MEHDKPNLRMRKVPSQSRSGFTVEAILDATVRIMTEQGLNYVTTEAIAEMAGVSIGSIYQYFPGTEAIIAELRRRHRRELNAAFVEALESKKGAGFEGSIREIVRVSIAVHAKDPRLHHLLVKYVDMGLEVSTDEPRFSVVSELSEFESYLRGIRGVSPKRAKTMVRVIYEITDSLVHAALIHKELDLENSELEDEIMCVVVGYFKQAGVISQDPAI